MNKTKLEVVRIDEDVIATSGICSHPGTRHYYVDNVDEPTEPKGYQYKKNEYVPWAATSNKYTTFSGMNWPANLAVGKWYYEDNSFTLHECNGTHSNYTIPDD